MENLELIGIVLTAASMMAALVVWVIKAVVAPLRVSLDTNSAVMERVLAKLDAHYEAIDDIWGTGDGPSARLGSLGSILSTRVALQRLLFRIRRVS